jgi:hypothetical protein
MVKRTSFALLLFLTFVVVPQAVAVHAVPKVSADVTVELGAYKFGVMETERVRHDTFGSSIVPGKQVEVYFGRYVAAIPGSLGLFASLLLALSGAFAWSAQKACRKFMRKV